MVYDVFLNQGVWGSLGTGTARLSQLTDNAFFWKISSDSGGTITNIGTGRCLYAPTVNPYKIDGVVLGGANDCGPNGLINSILVDYGHPNMHKCARLGQTRDWTNQGASCQEPLYGSTDNAQTVTITCPDGSALQSTSMDFLPYDYGTHVDYNFTCCTPTMPPYVTWNPEVTEPGHWVLCSYFLAGVHWNQGYEMYSRVQCMGLGSSMFTVDYSTQPLTTGTLDSR